MIHHPFMDRPIPGHSVLRDYKSQYKKVPIGSVLENCVAINHGLMCQSYYWNYNPRPKGAIEQVFVRKTIARKLESMDRELGPLGLRLLIQEGYRPLLVQQFVETHSVRKALQKENPEWPVEKLAEEAKKFAASASSDIETAPPPHLTGGAVDLTVTMRGGVMNGAQVPMGKSIGLYSTAFPEALESTEFEDHPARKYRRLLFWLAEKYGFATNPSEWWHISYGDQMWAWVAGAPYAKYGAVENLW